MGNDRAPDLLDNGPLVGLFLSQGNLLCPLLQMPELSIEISVTSGWRLIWPGWFARGAAGPSSALPPVSATEL